MDVREKLAFSVCNATQKTNYKCDFKCEKKGKCAYCLVMAEQMIAHGVTVLPCNVGQTIWLVYTPKHPADPNDKGKWFIEQDGVQRVIFGAKGVSIETWNMGTIPGKEIGKKLFFTKEEAQAALPQPPKGE